MDEGFSMPFTFPSVSMIEMASQTWAVPAEVDRSEWKHWLLIAEPEEIRHRSGLLFIGGGSNGDAPPGQPDRRLAAIALATHSVVAELRMVPNQPLTFSDDRWPRREDELIACIWNKFMDTGDAWWLAYFPMVKSAVRATDTIGEVVEKRTGDRVDRFVVAGGSKRGWTTWLSAAVDSRVTAIAPIVIDVLNVKPSMEHHFAAYGIWAPAIGDHEGEGIPERLGDPMYLELLKLVDSFSYRELRTLPKFLINSTGDQFFLPDSSQFYFDELPGEKYLRHVPNPDHGLDNSDAAESLEAFYPAILIGTPRPEFSWSLEGDASIHVRARSRPREVRLWHASNPAARDFRLETIDPVWTSKPLPDQGGGVCVGRVSRTKRGWTAFLVELTFDGPGGLPFKFTTAVRVVPETLPFERKI